MKRLVVMAGIVVAFGFGATGCDSGGGGNGEPQKDTVAQEDTSIRADDTVSTDDTNTDDTVVPNDIETPDDTVEPSACSADGDCTDKVQTGACKAARCNLQTSSCEAVNVENGTACDDNDSCTTSDICTNGVCGGQGTSCCGNGSCDEGETCELCASDCGTCYTCQQILTCSMDCISFECGEACVAMATPAAADVFEALYLCIKTAECDPSDNACIQANCAAEASACNSAPICGNSVCELGEDCTSCGQDCCPPAECGDGNCDEGEDTESCPTDCQQAQGSCVGNCGGQAPEGCYCDNECAEYDDCCADLATVCNSCGDGGCLGDETCTSCAQDCGACVVCGNGSCEEGEDCTSCEADCGVCPPQTCVGFCGGESDGGCYCDELCTENQDCCPDFATACPA